MIERQTSLYHVISQCCFRSCFLDKQPDIAAPGASILAAKEDSYVFMSGTSMAARHVSGVVAVLKALHPHWSPAAIKSAIVTSGKRAAADHYFREHSIPS
jgi:subtilisin family serine protease